MQKLNQRRTGSVLVLAVAATWLWAHEGHQALPPKGSVVKGNTVFLSPEARRAIDLRTAEVATETIERALEAPATIVLDAQAHAFVTTQLGGRVERVLVQPGQTVKAGDTLAVIRSLELERLALERASTRIELKLADQALDRAESLKGSLSKQELLTRRNRRKELTDALLVADIKLQALGVTISGAEAPALLPVQSPISGVVDHFEITPGVVVDPQQHLMDVVDVKRLRVRLDVPEAYVPQIAVGQPVRIQLRGVGDSHQLTGTLRARDGRVNPRTLTESAWVDILDGKTPLLPGMTGLARIVVERREKTLVIPEAALVREGLETVVFVQTEPGKYERKPVVTGLSAAGRVAITSGVLAIDTVVVQGQRQLAALFIQGVLRPSKEARTNTGLAVQAVGQVTVAPTVELDTVLELPPQSKTAASAPLTAQLAELLVTQPEHVEAGRPLARLRSLEFLQLQLDLLQADLAARLHEQTLAAYREAGPDSAIPRQLIQETESSLHLADAKRSSLRRQLTILGLTEEELESILSRREIQPTLLLRAARAGAAVPLDWTLGQIVKEGTPLFEIQDRSRVWARAHVTERDLPQLRPHQPARLRLTANRRAVIPTEVSRIESLPEADGSSRAAWAELPNADAALREQMLGRLYVSVGEAAKVLGVPLAALDREGSNYFVFVFDSKKDEFTRRQVRVGRQDDQFAEILSGLQAGEQIAVAAVSDLRRGYGRLK